MRGMADYTGVGQALYTEQTGLAPQVTLAKLRNSPENELTTSDLNHLSDNAATRITRRESDAELSAFVAALNMVRPVSNDKAALLLEHVIKESMSANIALLEGQMRTDGWDADLSQGETMSVLAERAAVFLESPEGVRLFNFFAKTFAKTTGEMFE